jgi:hypothetical protein
MGALESSFTRRATEEPSPFAGLDEIQTQLRRVVEDHDYGRALGLLEEQRRFFELAGRTHPETESRAHAAHDLCLWALTQVRLDREQLHRDLEGMSARKRAISSYAAAIPFVL